MAATNDGETVVLHVWKGDWGLPSIDPNSLAVLAYCKFSGVPLNVKVTGNPWASPSGNLPNLMHGSVIESDVHNIFTYLRKQNWGSDFELSTKQSADVYAFSSMLEEKLLPALLHLWWIDGKTYVDFTRPWYAKIMPFPLNFFMPGCQQKAANLRVFLTKGGENISDSDVEAKIYKEAKECLNLLSYKLGDKEFMFGKQPTSLDALIFGYLAPILKAPMPNNQLHNHLKQCNNLCELVERILQRYFPLTPEEAEKQKKKADQARESGASLEESEFPNRRRNMILAGFFAATAMFTYAFMSGLIQLNFLDKLSNDCLGRGKSSIAVKADCNNSADNATRTRQQEYAASDFDPLREEQDINEGDD